MKKIKLLCTILLFSNYHLLVGNSLQNKSTNNGYTKQSSTIYVEDESTMGQQPTNNNERENVVSISTSGTCDVKITGNTFVTLSGSTSSPVPTIYRIAGDLYVGSGSNLNFNMGYNLNNQGIPAVIVGGDITNNGTIHFANGTNGGNLAFQCHTMTNGGSLSL